MKEGRKGRAKGGREGNEGREARKEERKEEREGRRRDGRRQLVKYIRTFLTELKMSTLYVYTCTQKLQEMFRLSN